MACDICGKKAPLEELKAKYQTADIKHCCGECIGILEKHNRKLREECFKMHDTLLMRFMRYMRLRRKFK